MNCPTTRVGRTAQHAGGRLHGRHPRTHRAPRPDLPSGSRMTVLRATQIIADIAAMIPPPGGALRRDEPSWHAFGQVLAEAASLVAAAVSHDGGLLRQALVRPPVECDPVQRTLVEMALAIVD